MTTSDKTSREDLVAELRAACTAMVVPDGFWWRDRVLSLLEAPPSPPAQSQSDEEAVRRLCEVIGLSMRLADASDDDPTCPDDDAFPVIIAFRAAAREEEREADAVTAANAPPRFRRMVTLDEVGEAYLRGVDDGKKDAAAAIRARGRR